MKRRLCVVLCSALTLLCLILTACGDESATCPSCSKDGGAGCPDASAPDAELPDSMMPDSAAPDSALPDSAVIDAFIADQAIPDLPPPDMFVPDMDPCGPGTVLCGAVCVNLQSDNLNCGKCASPCAAGQVCSGGKCALTCQSSLTDCNGTCVNVQSDNQHCGKCASPCAAGEVCSNGKCSLTCQSSLTDCGGVCTNLQTDLFNCGKCNKACASGDLCSSGICCAAGQTSCSGTCKDLQTDDKNCGACGKVCGTSSICLKGKCETALASCAAILAAKPGVASGVYFIKPGTGAPFQVYCDMKTDGGGWTRFWWYTAGAGLTGVTDMLGQDLSACKTTDKRCQAIIPWAAPKELMTTSDNTKFQIYKFTNGTTSKRVMASLTKRTPWLISGGGGDGWAPVKAVGTTIYKSGEGGAQARFWWYDTKKGVKSFNLDNDSGWCYSFFTAGVDYNSSTGGSLGVDHTDTGCTSNNALTKNLYLYVR